MKESKEITAFQATAIVINSTIGISVLVLPRIASERVGSGAILVTILAALISIISIGILGRLARRFPRESIIKYGQSIVSKPLGKIFGLALILFFAITTSLVVREFGEVMETTLLEDTPITATILTMLLLVAVATRNTMTTISYMHTYYLPFIIIPILLMVFLAVKDMDMRFLKPFWGNEVTFFDFVNAALSVSGLPFIQIGIFIIMVITPYMVEPKKIVRASFWGVIISCLLILLATGATVAVFGSEELKKSLWPMLVLTRMTVIPAEILERLDIVFLVVWIISAFTTILSGYLICIEFFSQLFDLRSHRVVSYLALPIIFVMSMYPKNVLHMYQLISVTGKWGLLLTIGYPALLLLAAFVRKKGGSKIEKTESSH